MRVTKTGNEAIAEAMRQINPDVVAAYPITPATEIVQIFSNFVADGLVDTVYTCTESEHSAMSACIGAAACGARTMTATAAQGLAMMWEMLYIASGLRLPIILAQVNRTLSSPINIHCDHSDTMGSRDSGWIQIYCENAQEAYDSTIQAVRMAEECLLPAMVNIDGFIISHGMECLHLIEDEKVKEFVGEYKPRYSLLDVDNPITIGAIAFTDYYFEHKRQTIEAMRNSKEIIVKVCKEFGSKFGRNYGLVEEYKLDDAEMAIVVLGSTAGTARVVINELRQKGIKAGMLRVRIFRPFPAEEIVQILSRIPCVAVMDRCDSLSGQGGPVFTEIRSALYESDIKPKMVNYIYGLGGRNVSLDMIRSVYEDLKSILDTGKIDNRIRYLGVRE